MINSTTLPKILVVDDVEANRLVLRRLLKKVDCEVIEAANGNDALALCLEHRFALILLDVNMPEMDGYEVAEILHGDVDTAQIPIVFVTAAYGDELHKMKAYELGAVDYLFKPIEDKILLSKVNVFLQLDKQRLALSDALAEVNQLNQHNRLILETTTQAMLSINGEGIVTLANPASERILRAGEAPVVGRHLASLLRSNKQQDDQSWQHSAIGKAIVAGQSLDATEAKLCRDDGDCFPVELAFAPFSQHSQSYTGGVMMFDDITQRKWAEAELIRLAKEDPLTQLANRTLFNEFLESALARCQRHHERMALFFLDLDHFKQVNDNLGHDAGDQLLVSVTRRMKKCLRHSDVIARIGGDEFAVLMPHLNDISETTHVAEKMIKLMESPHEVGSRMVTVSFSIGIVTYPEAGESTEELLKAADTAMYYAKEQGRNNFQYFQPEMQRQAVLRSQLEESLKSAVRNEEFICHYQPQVSAATGRPIALEALVRWQSPQRGMVPPFEFISVAEEIGAILPIGEQVLRMACKNFKEWKNEGLMGPRSRVAVNISIHQLRRGNLINSVTRVLSETGVEPVELELEITESTVMDNPKSAIEILTELRAMGIQIAVDDFGTGYSSLMYLKQLPISSLKIDRGFVADIGKDKNDEAIVIATINLAHSLGLSVTAEGVETVEQAAFLRTFACDQLQGYYFSKPQSAEEISKWLRDEGSDPIAAVS